MEGGRGPGQGRLVISAVLATDFVATPYMGYISSTILNTHSRLRFFLGDPCATFYFVGKKWQSDNIREYLDTLSN